MVGGKEKITTEKWKNKQQQEYHKHTLREMKETPKINFNCEISHQI